MLDMISPQSLPSAAIKSGAGAPRVPAEIALADLTPGTTARVVCVRPTDAKTPVEVGRRLAELGFLPGEAVRIVARGLFARAPIAVRIGTGTFALRLFEAACVRVRPELP
jgi:ferrous iron transport protein A